MIRIPVSVLDGPAKITELRRYTSDVWTGRNWTVWIEESGSGWSRRFLVHIGGKNAQGVLTPAETYAGHNRQQALLRAKIYLVALMKSRILATFGYTLEGINVLRARMGLEPVDGSKQHTDQSPRAPRSGKEAQGSTARNRAASGRTRRGVGGAKVRRGRGR